MVYVIYLLTNLTYHRTSSSNDISLLDLSHTLLWFLLFHIYMNILLLLGETFFLCYTIHSELSPFFMFIVCFYFNIKVLSSLLFYRFLIGKNCVLFHCETYKNTKKFRNYVHCRYEKIVLRFFKKILKKYLTWSSLHMIHFI